MLLLVMMGSLTQLAQSQDGPDRKALKEEQSQKAAEAIMQLVESRNFEFEADRLISSTGFSNSIVTTPNVIRIQGDQVRIYLPYFGELRANTPYQVDGGIKYEGVMEGFSTDFKERKRITVVKFGIDRGIEDHDFYMYINKDGQTRVTVISSGRTSISYYGPTTEIREESGF